MPEKHEQPEEFEIPDDLKDKAWKAGIEGEKFPVFKKDLPEKVLEGLFWLWERAREEGLVEVKIQFGGNTERQPANKYRIREEIGQGGIGIVYRGFDQELRKTVAIKILSSEFAIERARTEGWAGAGITSHYVVTTLDSGTLDDGSSFIVMDFIKGASLDSYIKPGKPLDKSSFLQAYKWMKEICLAMAVAGDETREDGAIIHRDLKPSNILIDDDTREVRLCDFGLARFPFIENPHPEKSDEEANLIGTQGFLGTPEYVAPEQAADATNADQRSDIYSLGATFYHLFTGKFPTGSSPREKIKRLKREGRLPTPEAPHKLNPDLPEAIGKLIMWCLETEPTRRPSTFTEILEGSAEILTTGSPPSSWKGLIRLIADMDYEEEQKRRERDERGLVGTGGSRIIIREPISPLKPGKGSTDSVLSKISSSSSVSRKEARGKGESVTDPASPPDKRGKEAKGGPGTIKEKPSERGPRPSNTRSEAIKMAESFDKQGKIDIALEILAMKRKEDPENIPVLLKEAELLRKRDRNGK